MKSYILLIILFFTNFSLVAQTSVVQDTKGETSLSIGNTGVVAINAKDESISFSYGILLNKSKDRDVNAEPDFVFNYLGVTVKGKGKNGIINAIKNDEFQYDGSIGLFYFQDRTYKKDEANKDNKNKNKNDNDNLFQWHLSSEFLFSQFKLYDNSPSLSFDKQIYDNNNKGYKITGGINYMGKLTKSLPYLLGIALNGGHKNNTTDLKSLEISNIITQYDPITNQTRSIEKDKTNAYDVNQYKKSLAYSNFNIDVGPQFFDQYLLLLHSRWSVQDDRKPQWNPALGLYFTKSGAPLEIVAGIQVQTLDWYNTSSSLKTRNERTTINIVSGFTF